MFQKEYMATNGRVGRLLSTGGIVTLSVLALVWSLSALPLPLVSISGKAVSIDAAAAEKPATQLSCITPEYTRTMKRVVLSLAQRDSTLKYHHNILKHMPEYADIELLVPRHNQEQIKDMLSGQSYAERVHIIPFDSKPSQGASILMVFPEEEKLKQVDLEDTKLIHKQGTMWAQDLFEVGVDRVGNSVLLIPDVHKAYHQTSLDNPDESNNVRVTRDNAFLMDLSNPITASRLLPLVFKGGNILSDHLNGRNIVFCGGDVLRTTRIVWLATTETRASDSRIIRTLKRSFNADEVIVLGKDRLQPARMYHLDQAMIILPGGIAGVARIVKDSTRQKPADPEILEAEEFLRETRTKLRSLGYQLFDVKVTEQNIMNCQHYINAIPYMDWRTGEKTLLMPVYSSQHTELDQKLIDENIAAFETLDYRVVEIPTDADQLNGGIHCLINVIE